MTMYYMYMYMCTLYHHVVTELLYPLQKGYAPLYLAVVGNYITCMEHLLSNDDIVYGW